ncbi:lytic transglycosylase domain-containing protein [Methylobacterium phyllosphaerae]
MQALTPIDQHEFWARTHRSAIRRRAQLIAWKCTRSVVLAGSVLLGAGLMVLPLQPDRAEIAPVAAIPVPPPRPASFVAIMSAEGVTAGFVRASLKAANGEAALPQFIGTLEDTWLNAFYGDKQRLRQFIEHTANSNGLPVDFFLRLLQQESGLNHRAVSRAGAQGVAQFMPATAAERGLVDPFDPFEAIPKAAEFLREQRAAFGSLGLAAAAYNAGPQRVRNWLAGRSLLPQETRAYVAKITGRSAEDWRQGGDMLTIAEPAARNGW